MNREEELSEVVDPETLAQAQEIFDALANDGVRAIARLSDQPEVALLVRPYGQDPIFCMPIVEELRQHLLARREGKGNVYLIWLRDSAPPT